MSIILDSTVIGAIYRISSKTENDLKVERMINISKRVSGITIRTPFRIYRGVNNKNIEYIDDICILLDIYLIADPRKKTLFVIFDFHLRHPVNIKLG